MPAAWQFKSVKAHLGWAGASAILLALAFPRPGLGFVAWVALVPVAILAQRSSSLRRLWWSTLLVSWVWWIFMIWWLKPVAGAGHVVLSAYLALYLPLAMGLLRWMSHRLGAVCGVALPVVWVSLEMVRGTIVAGGFGWFALSHTQAPYLPEHAPGRIIQIADLFGEHGVSFLLAMTNGLLVDLLIRPLFAPVPGGRRRMNRSLQAMMLLWLGMVGGAWAYGQWRIGQWPVVIRSGPQVALVQTNIVQNNKDNPTPQQMQQDWLATIKLSGEAAVQQPRPDLLAWPESTPPGSIDPDSRGVNQRFNDFHEQIAQTARSNQLNLLIGAIARLNWQANEVGELRPHRKYNSVFFYDRSGRQSATRYDKIHRVPFGEYLPWIETFPGLKKWFIKYLTPYDYDYTIHAGGSIRLFGIPITVDGQRTDVRIATPICFEDTVGRLCRRMVYEKGRKRADMILNLTNDGWFAGSAQPIQHFQIAVYRSIENRVPTARCVNTGISGMIDSVGRVGPQIQQDVDGYVAAALKLDLRHTLYGRFGHLPVFLLIAAATSLVFLVPFGRVKLKNPVALH